MDKKTADLVEILVAVRWAEEKTGKNIFFAYHPNSAAVSATCSERNGDETKYTSILSFHKIEDDGWKDKINQFVYRMVGNETENYEIGPFLYTADK